MPKESANLDMKKKIPSRGGVRRVARKAPTPLRQRATVEKTLRNQIVVSVIVFLVISFSSIGIGIADEGQINVIRVIEERNERVAEGGNQEGSGNQEGGENPEGTTIIQKVPVVQSSQNKLPDGGLKGLGKSGKKPEEPQESPVTEISSTTDESTASTTDEVVEEQESSEEEVVSETEEAVTQEEEQTPDESVPDETVVE